MKSKFELVRNSRNLHFSYLYIRYESKFYLFFMCISPFIGYKSDFGLISPYANIGSQNQGEC